MRTAETADRPFPRGWPLLFPLTYLVHIVEESVGGFPVWAARFIGFRLSAPAFLAINEYALVTLFALTG